jgi:hypothetical protein
VIGLAVIIFFFIAIAVLSSLSGGILIPILSQMFSLFKPVLFNRGNDQVHVRDVRLRDERLQEHSVRFRGELHSGQAMVGDTIEIWGRNRGGTIMARWGYNFRTSTRIWVKYQ